MAQDACRTDISCTLFLADPDDYDGGELVIEDTFGKQRLKLAAGDMVLYPGTSVHRVEPVTRGHRAASFFWIESMVRSDEQRRLLFDMDSTCCHLRSTRGETDRGHRRRSPARTTTCCACGLIRERRSRRQRHSPGRRYLGRP